MRRMRPLLPQGGVRGLRGIRVQPRPENLRTKRPVLFLIVSRWHGLTPNSIFLLEKPALCRFGHFVHYSIDIQERAA